MISLTEDLDRSVEINGTEYEVDDCFSTVLQVFETSDADEALRLILKGRIPDIDEEKRRILLDKIMSIFVYEKRDPIFDLAGNQMPEMPDAEWFSFKYDADLIFSGFMQSYGLDLRKERCRLRWGEFIALLSGLPASTRFREVLEIRMRPWPTGEGSEDERERLRDAKRSLSYPGVDFVEQTTNTE